MATPCQSPRFVPTPLPLLQPVVPSTLAEGWKHGYFVTPDLDCEGGDALRCLNSEAVWKLSGARPGNGVDCILDSNVSGVYGVGCGRGPD